MKVVGIISQSVVRDSTAVKEIFATRLPPPLDWFIGADQL